MNRFLTVVVPHANDELIDNVDKTLRTWDYKREYRRSIAPPNIIEYSFGPMPDTTIEATKAHFRKLFSTMPDKYKSYCSFIVYDEE
jgi:hypothetical protein